MDITVSKISRLLPCLLVVAILPKASSATCNTKTVKGYVAEHWNLVNTRITRTCGDDEKVTFPMDPPEDNPACNLCKDILILKQIQGNAIPPSAFENYNGTTTLYLDNLDITTITPGAFESLNSLDELHLKGNQIRKIEAGVLQSVEELTILDVSGNTISSMKDISLEGTAKLRSVNLSSNLLTEIEKKDSWNNITHLDLSYNRIKIVDAKSFPPNLTVLNMSSNALSTFDVHKNFSELLLGNNLLQSFDFSWTNHTINKIHLENNKIERIVGKYCHVIDIDLSGNKLISVPCDCSNTSANVEVLNLANNLISYVVPQTIAELTNLKELHLELNQIKVIKAGTFASLTKLLYLNISHNAIEEFEMGSVDNIKNVEDFDVSYNKLKGLKRYIMHTFPNLKHLHLQYNNITFINATNLNDDLLRIWDINIVGNNLTCDNIFEIIRIFNKRPVHFYAGPFKNVTNVHGMACTLTNGTTGDDFAESFNNAEINGAIADYFNHDYKESNFFKFLEELQNADTMIFNETQKLTREMEIRVAAHKETRKLISNNAGGVSGYLIAIILCLLAITVFIGLQGYILYNKFRTRTNDGERLLLLPCLLVVAILPKASSATCNTKTVKGYVAEHWNLVNTRITRTCGDDEKVTFPMDPPEDNPACNLCKDILILKQIQGNAIPPSAFENYNGTTTLYLDNLDITTITPGAFESLNSLDELHLKGNQIRKIEAGVLQSVEELTILDVSGNTISSMKDISLEGTAKLRSVNLSSNLLTEIEKKDSWNNITHLDLSYNRIKIVDAKSFPPNLTVLNMSSNALSTFDVHKNFSELLLGNNLLQSFDFSWTNHTINKIHLENNKIERIVGKYCHVIDIDLSGNKLISVPCDCSNTSANVEVLNLANNLISYVVPQTIAELTNLKELHLELNQIKVIKAGTFASLTKLLYLNISHNAIEEFEMGSVDNIKNVEDFDVSYNKLKGLKRYIMHTFPNLKHLHLQYNNITFINATNLNDDLLRIWDINIVGNNLTCDNIFEIIRIFNKRPVHFYAGPFKNVTNVHGMACTLTNGTTGDDFAESFNNAEINGAIADYFNHDYKESNFFKFLEELQNADTMIFNETQKLTREMEIRVAAHKETRKLISNNAGGVSGYLIAIILCLLAITVFIGLQGYILYNKFRTRTNDGERLL